MKKDLEEFYNNLEKLKFCNNEVSNKRKELESLVENFSSKINSIKLDSKLEKNNKEIASIFHSTLDNAKGKIEEWRKYFDNALENEKFRQELQDNFIVIVYGKVKAGKSTLGNFVAENANTKAEFEKVKYNKKTKLYKFKKIKNFKTKVTECTSDIQLFRLGGMAWVDTPGLGSLTQENGDLARDCIAAADYVILPTSSESPFQNDDIESLKELKNLKKKVYVIITKSDEFVKDEIDGKLVEFQQNKDSNTRKDQEENGLKRIKEKGLDKSIDNKILSLSTYMAQQGLQKNDEDIFISSNMPRFYQSLNNVLQNKAFQLKQETPYKSLITLIDTITIETNDKDDNSLESMREIFNEAYEYVEETRNKIHECQKQLHSEISSGLERIITNFYAEELNYKNKTSKEINQLLHTYYLQPLRDKIANRLSEVIKELQIKIDEKIPKIDTEIKVKTKSIKHQTTDFLRTIGSIFTFGYIDKYETYYTSEVVGDNKGEVVASLIKKYESYFKNTYIPHYIKVIEENFFNEYKNIFKKIENYIGGLEEEIEKLKSNLKNQNNKTRRK